VAISEMLELGASMPDQCLHGHAVARQAMLRFAYGAYDEAARIAQRLVSNRYFTSSTFDDSAALLDLAGYRVAADHPAALRTAKFAVERNTTTCAYARFLSLCNQSAALAGVGRTYAALDMLKDVQRRARDQHWAMRRLERRNIERCASAIRQQLGPESVLALA
jgi:hypothetical protein